MQPINLPGEHKRYTHVLDDGETRMCLDPWSKVFIKINGDVALCCNAPAVGSIKDTPLLEILEDDTAKAYRNGLLSGKPLHPCQVCPDRSTTTPQKLKTIVKEYLAGNTDIIDKMESL